MKTCNKVLYSIITILQWFYHLIMVLYMYSVTYTDSYYTRYYKATVADLFIVNASLSAAQVAIDTLKLAAIFGNLHGLRLMYVASMLLGMVVACYHVCISALEVTWMMLFAFVEFGLLVINGILLPLAKFKATPKKVDATKDTEMKGNKSEPMLQ